MYRPVKLHEIDHHTLKLIVGVISISLGLLTSLLSSVRIESISESYYEIGLARDIFVGFQFAIGSFLLAYNGEGVWEMGLSKLAALSAIGVAVFPCSCGGHPVAVPRMHGIFAGLMFVILVCFCIIFYRRARAKKRRKADWRAFIYATCGVIITLSIILLTWDYLTGGAIRSKALRLPFYLELAALTAFGVSWLVASRVILGITDEDERIRLKPIKKAGTPQEMPK
jgi:Protein of unknown function (DUF998)